MIFTALKLLADVSGRVVGTTASYALNMLAGPTTPMDALWDETTARGQVLGELRKQTAELGALAVMMQDLRNAVCGSSDRDSRWTIKEVFAEMDRVWDERPDPMELFDRIRAERQAAESSAEDCDDGLIADWTESHAKGEGERLVGVNDIIPTYTTPGGAAVQCPNCGWDLQITTNIYPTYSHTSAAPVPYPPGPENAAEGAPGSRKRDSTIVGDPGRPTEIVRPAIDEDAIALLKSDPAAYFEKTRRQLPDYPTK